MIKRLLRDDSSSSGYVMAATGITCGVLLFLFFVVVQLGLATLRYLYCQYYSIQMVQEGFKSVEDQSGALQAMSYMADLFGEMSSNNSTPFAQDTPYTLSNNAVVTFHYDSIANDSDRITAYCRYNLDTLAGLFSRLATIPVGTRAVASRAPTFLSLMVDNSQSLASDHRADMQITAASAYNPNLPTDPVTNPIPTKDEQLLLPFSRPGYLPDILNTDGSTNGNLFYYSNDPAINPLHVKFAFANAIEGPVAAAYQSHYPDNNPAHPWLIEPSFYTQLGMTPPPTPTPGPGGEIGSSGQYPPGQRVMLENLLTDRLLAYRRASEFLVLALAPIVTYMDVSAFAARTQWGPIAKATDVSNGTPLNSKVSDVFPIFDHTKYPSGNVLTTPVVPNDFLYYTLTNYSVVPNAPVSYGIGAIFIANFLKDVIVANKWSNGTNFRRAFYANVAAKRPGVAYSPLDLYKPTQYPCIGWNPNWDGGDANPPTNLNNHAWIEPTNVTSAPEYWTNRYPGALNGLTDNAPNLTSCLLFALRPQSGGTGTADALKEGLAGCNKARGAKANTRCILVMLTDGNPGLEFSTPLPPSAQGLINLGYQTFNIDWQTHKGLVQTQKTALINEGVLVFTVFTDYPGTIPPADVVKMSEFKTLMDDPSHGFYYVEIKTGVSNSPQSAILNVTSLLESISSLAALLKTSPTITLY